MSKVIFVNRFYAPDYSATSQLLSDLATALARLGHDVHVLASNHLYNDDQIELPLRETIEGVSVHRVVTARPARGNLLRRAVAYVSDYRAFFGAIRELANAGDIVIAKTDPPLLGVIIERALKGRGVTLVNWLQDVYPEVASELGVPFLRGPIRLMLQSLRTNALAVAKWNVVIGDVMARRLVSINVEEKSIRVIPNWAKDSDIRPVEHADNPLRTKWGLEHKFVVSYSGNLGRAHEFETLVQAAVQLKSRPDVVFLFVGGGHHVERLRARVDALGLGERFQFRPYQDEAMLKFSLSVADVHWLSLLPNLEGLIVPSKFYGIAAAGRPTLSVTSRDGEIGTLVRLHNCGYQVDLGDSKTLASAIIALADDHATWRRLCYNARAFIDLHSSRQRAIGLWSELLNDIKE